MGSGHVRVVAIAVAFCRACLQWLLTTAATVHASICLNRQTFAQSTKHVPKFAASTFKVPDTWPRLKHVPGSVTKSERNGMSEKARQESVLNIEKDSLRSQKEAAIAKIKAIDARTKAIKAELNPPKPKKKKEEK